MKRTGSFKLSTTPQQSEAFSVLAKLFSDACNEMVPSVQESNGKVFGGGKLRHDRDRYLASRRRLQSNGSRASKRKLKAFSGKEQRHVRHVNHETSKAIVA
jgi:hypothetical protein